jgi:hypothetical protein
MNFSERELGRAFREELKKQKFLMQVIKHQKEFRTSFKVYLNKRVPTHSKKFRRFWEAENIDPANTFPPQPEIDMILEDNTGEMRAIELKVIRKYKNSFRPSYYRGIDQALAYLHFGFPQVGLWQCFDGDTMQDKEIVEYNNAFEKIVFPLKDYLETTFFRILRAEKKLKIQTRIFYNLEKTWRWEDGIGVPINGNYLMRWTSNNPLVSGFKTSKGYMPTAPIFSKPAKTIYKFLEQQRNFWKG